jgi:hypothetical protein
LQKVKVAELSEVCRRHLFPEDIDPETTFAELSLSAMSGAFGLLIVHRKAVAV